MEAETFRPTHRKTQWNQTPKGNMGNLQLVLTVLLLTPSLAKFWCRRFSQKPYLGWLTMGATRSNSCARDHQALLCFTFPKNSFSLAERHRSCLKFSNPYNWEGTKFCTGAQVKRLPCFDKENGWEVLTVVFKHLSRSCRKVDIIPRFC